MGWEEEIPAVPTRDQELKFIKELEENYRQQPNYKFYMSEALRRTKMAESEIINDYRRHFAVNYMIGTEYK